MSGSVAEEEPPNLLHFSSQMKVFRHTAFGCGSRQNKKPKKMVAWTIFPYYPIHVIDTWSGHVWTCFYIPTRNFARSARRPKENQKKQHQKKHSIHFWSCKITQENNTISSRVCTNPRAGKYRTPVTGHLVLSGSNGQVQPVHQLPSLAPASLRSTPEYPDNLRELTHWLLARERRWRVGRAATGAGRAVVRVVSLTGIDQSLRGRNAWTV